MPKILFKSNHIELRELAPYRSILQQLSLNAQKAKKMAGVTYHNLDVYRIKLNDKARLVYTYVPYEGQDTLLILEILENHEYNKLELKCLDGIQNYQELDDDDEVVASEKEEKSQEPEYIPVVSYNDKHIQLSDAQTKAVGQKFPLLMSGPPGSGKTAVAFCSLQNFIKARGKPPEIYFISPSKALLSRLSKTHESQSAVKVHFSTWEELLQRCYLDKKSAGDYFYTWIQDKGVLKDIPPKIIHYEMSLIVALGPDKYSQLGARQSYFQNDKAKQGLVITLLQKWQDFLGKNNLFDRELPARLR